MSEKCNLFTWKLQPNDECDYVDSDFKFAPVSDSAVINVVIKHSFFIAFVHCGLL